MSEVFKLDNFKLYTNYVIEASAGTGKTYNIVEIVNKIVNQAENSENKKIKLDQILIVTYTEKAAGELKNRIRDKLKGEDVDNASIFTIHSFCQQAIKEFGISANLPLELSVINDDKLDAFANRYLRESDIIKDITFYASLKDFKINSLRKMLCESLKKYYLDNDYNDDDTIIKMEEFSYDEEFIFNLFKTMKIANETHDVLFKYPEIYDHYLVFANSLEPKAQEFKQLLDKCFNKNFEFKFPKFSKSTVWSKNPIIREELEKEFKYFADLKDKLKKSHHEKVTDIYAYLTRLYLKDFYEKWQKEKELNKYQTFNDMLRSVRESVLEKDSLLKKKLMEKYQYAIIDEFQDTNQLQFDIFKNVFITKDHYIIVVGDPKQSIYSFQGADVAVYHQAKEVIRESGGVICELNKNYRSTPSVVKSCNKLFEFFQFDGTEFTPCNTLNDKDDQKEHKVLYSGYPAEGFWIPTNCEMDAEDFAKIAVETIVDCCQVDENGHTKLRVKDKGEDEFRNVSFKDFAVLARSRTEMDPMERALKSAGIPFIRYKDTRLFIGKECADWIAIFEAINCIDLSGSKRKKFKKILFTNFFKLDLKKIADEKFEKDDSKEIHLLKKWQQESLKRNWEGLVDSIIVDSGIIDKLTSLGEIQSLGVYKQIGNYCIEYLSDNHSIDDLIVDLQAKAKGGSDDSESGPIIAKSTNFDCVQMMTMHASKGLQYPVVIPVGGFKGMKPDNIVTYHGKENGKDVHVLGFLNNPLSDKEKIEEIKRLYYVAYTRAQFVMILPYYKRYGKDLNFLGESISKFMIENPKMFRELSNHSKNIKDLINDVKVILSKKSLENKLDEPLDAKETQFEILDKIIKEKNGKSTFKYSYSTLTHPKKHEEELEDVEDENTEGLEIFDKSSVQIFTDMDFTITEQLLPSSFPRGNKVGSALHKIFELIDYTNYQDEVRSVIEKSFKDEGIKLSDDLLDDTINMVDNVLNAKLPIIKGSSKLADKVLLLSSLSKDKIKPEVEFNFNYKNQKLKNYFNGFIDLLFKNGEVYSILDWKSDSLNEEFSSYTSNEELKKHVDKAYSIQRVLYSYCLIKWLKTYYSDKSEEEIFSNHFGGVYYVFLRGCHKETGNGIYCQTWNSFKDLEKEFYNIMNHKMWGGKHE